MYFLCVTFVTNHYYNGLISSFLKFFLLLTFIKHGSKKGAALNALSNWIDTTIWLDKNTLMKSVNSHKYANKLSNAIQHPVLN